MPKMPNLKNMGGSGFSLLDAIMAGLGIKGLFGGGGGGQQERQTFENETGYGGVGIDPKDLLGRGVEMGETQFGQIQNRAMTPVQLRSSYVQQPPTFTGGGMPMPIGVSGYDPALANPGLQQGEGLTMGGSSQEGQEALAALELIKGDQWKPGRG